MKKRVLWIEDGAFDENMHLATPVYQDGRFDLKIALDATTGWNEIVKGNFEVAICDIRLPPGDGQYWIESYYARARKSEKAQLGIRLLERLYTENPAWFDRIGVLTVETRSEIAKPLNDLGLEASYYQKEGVADTRLLLRAIEEILERKDGRTP